MNCRQISKKIEEYASNGLDIEKAGLVREHLDICNSCSMSHQSILELMGNLNSSTKIKAPQDFTDKVMHSIIKVKANETQDNSISGYNLAVYRRLGVSMLVTAAILLLGLIYIPQSGLNVFSNKINIGTYIISQNTEKISSGLGKVNYKVEGLLSNIDNSVNMIIKEKE